jgi:Rps23 Pro-64 3,4-dihydroxylase Tpa1-like proline 4-hydroxylase
MIDENILKIFDSIDYRDLALRNTEKYQNNLPFPHIVLDNFLPKELAKKIADAFPTSKSNPEDFKFHGNKNVQRFLFENVNSFNTNLRLFTAAISSRSFLLFLETLTGLKHLIPDPYFLGGGAMATGNGGYLNTHIDFNWNQKIQAWRACNVLFYFSKDWLAEYNGNLVLYSEDGKEPIKEIEPLFNRIVIFNTTSKSYHGQPKKLECPEGVFRNLFSAFYYSSTKAEAVSDVPHYTNYADSNLENQKAEFVSSPYADLISEQYLNGKF